MPRPAEVSARHVGWRVRFPRRASGAPSAPPPRAERSGSLGAAAAPFARSDLLLNSTQWSSQVVGKTSPWIDADSASAPSRRDGEAALRQELMWAAHLSLHAVLLPTPSFSAANYARVVNQFLSALSSTCLLYTSPSPRDGLLSRMPSSA